MRVFVADRRHRRVSRLSTRLAVLAAAVGLLATPACGSGDSSEGGGESADLSFQLDFLYAGYQAPFFLAKEAGYWEQEGVNVTIRQGNGSANGIKTLLGGANQVGMFDRSTMAVSIPQDPNLLAVMGIDNRGGWCVATPTDEGVTSPQQLVGKTVATQLGGADGTLLPAFWDANEIDPSEVEVQSVAPEAKTSLLEGGKVDGSTYINYAQVPQVEAAGLELNTMLWSDHGLPVIGTGLITTKTWADENPETLRAFVAGTVRAFEEAARDPEAAVDAFMKSNPDFDRTVAAEQLELILKALEGPGTKGKPLGWQTAESWKETVATLEQVELVSRAEAPAEYFTNEYLPDP